MDRWHAFLDLTRSVAWPVVAVVAIRFIGLPIARAIEALATRTPSNIDRPDMPAGQQEPKEKPGEFRVMTVREMEHLPEARLRELANQYLMKATDPARGGGDPGLWLGAQFFLSEIGDRKMLAYTKSVRDLTWWIAGFTVVAAVSAVVSVFRN